jgi:hypothetical protein
MFEFIFELLFEVIGELVLNLIFSFLGEIFGHTFSRNREPFHPVLAALGYALVGAACGRLTLIFFPQAVLVSHATQLANLVITPVLAGGAMALLGAWRTKRGQDKVRLDKFSYGYVFALAFGFIRYWFASP